MTATSDYGPVEGIYGMSLNPITEVMYVCYQSGGGASSRRLGIMDEETAVITDIGNCGNIIDMDFGPDGTLYGSTGNFSPDYSFVVIDIATAAQIFIFDYTPSSYGGGMAYNQFSDEMYYQNNSGSSIVDLATFVETVGSPTGSPGETQAMEILTPTLGWMAFYGTLYTFNPVTEVYSASVSIDSYHAFAFGAEPCDSLVLSSTAMELCEGEELTLTATGPGTISWDSDVTDGVAFIPGAAGEYTFVATTDDLEACSVNDSVQVEVIAVPTVTAVASSELICIGDSIVLSGDGDAHVYSWDVVGVVDGEFYEPLTVGTVEHIVVGTDTVTACTNSDTIEVEVVELVEAGAVATDELFGSDGTIDLSYTGGAAVYTFDWDNDGTGDFDDPEDLTDLDPGTYTVIVMSEAGCSDTTSATVGTQLSVDVIDGVVVKTYPNPTEDHLFIEVEGTFTYELINVGGSLIMNGQGIDKEMIDLSELTSGAYFLSLKKGEFLQTIKVTKK
jgi:hypothetical protein